jgi:hypothetical protein
VAVHDSPDHRLEPAQAVCALRDEGRIPWDLAVVAVLELDGEEPTPLFSPVAESLAVLARRAEHARRDPRGDPIAGKGTAAPAARLAENR